MVRLTGCGQFYDLEQGELNFLRLQRDDGRSLDIPISSEALSLVAQMVTGADIEKLEPADEPDSNEPTWGLG